MKKYTLLWLFASLLIFSGCNLVDEAKKEYEKLKNEYNEYEDNITRGPKPFKVVYGKDENAKKALITSHCSSNKAVKYVHFGTQVAAQQHVFTAIKNLYSYPYKGVLKPFWDTRYTNPMSQYINGGNAPHYPNHAERTGLDARTGIRNITVGTGLSQVDASASVVQSKCVDGLMVAGTNLTLFDAPEQTLTYAGIQSTFAYHIHSDNHIRPWKTDGTGNLLIQAHFDTPIYTNFSNNIGGSVSYNVFLYNPKTKQHLNYVIGVYAAGVAWRKEKAGIRFDPTTNIIHVATVVKDTSWWTTISKKSNEIQEITSKANTQTKDDGKWENFYRINISYQNLLAVLNELKTNPPVEVAGQDFGLSPKDWEVTLVALQYELEEGGKAALSGSFRGFEAYTSPLPL